LSNGKNSSKKGIMLSKVTFHVIIGEAWVYDSVKLLCLRRTIGAISCYQKARI
jgi:hypothetical protein